MTRTPIRITVGKALDGALCARPRSALGELTVGPLGLLSWLESQLGLKLPEVSFTARMIRYLACLKQAAPGRFYERSLAQDEFGTARTLLQWRDTWCEAGWDGRAFGDGVSARLADMAAVEAFAHATTPPGTGERVQRVIAALEALGESVGDQTTGSGNRPARRGGEAPLAVELTLLDSAESFPQVWRELFAKLGARIVPLEASPAAPESTDLGRLQRALLDRRAPGEKLALDGDGSVLVLRDGSPQLSAPWVARFAHGCNEANRSAGEHAAPVAASRSDETDSIAGDAMSGRGGGDEPVGHAAHDLPVPTVGLLATEYGATLDDALTAAGHPRLGFADTSYWRPVFQVLPLALELSWRPLDPNVLLQFLTHPMGPIPARIRRPLAQVVANEPGIGGPGWMQALNAALDDAAAAAAGDNADEMTDADRAKHRATLAAEVELWLNPERFDTEPGAPVDFLLDRTRRISKWLANAFAALQARDEVDPEATLYGAALGQADELVRTLERLRDAGTTTLPRIGVRRLIEAVRGTGTSRPGRPAQCAPAEPQILRADSPAAFIEPLQTVIWWACDHEHLPGQYPWSRAERAELKEQGVDLLPLSTTLTWQAASWLRPIMAAEKQLVLVLHDNADGHHPVFDEIVAVAGGWAEARVDELMREPDSIPGAGPLPSTRVIAPRKLPEKTRWWQLPKNVALPPRTQESYSSLEKFLFGPHRWVLDYEAKIRPGALEAIDDGALLRGNLAHALFERYFATHEGLAALDPTAAARWARQHAGELIEQQGAVLATPGRQAEKEHFIGTASTALRVLVEHLKSASVTKVKMETPLAGRFKGGALGGTIDLIATKPSGATAVLDLKWGRFEARRRDLADSNYLQLAVYAQLLHQNGGQWPALGFFVISDARLAMLASDFFPDAVVEQPANGENILEFWQRVEETWAWRRAQLDEGRVEVPVTDTEPDDASDPGDRGLPLPETFDRYDDYVFLTGWNAES